MRLNPTAPRSTENARPCQLFGLEAHDFSEFAAGGRACFSRVKKARPKQKSLSPPPPANTEQEQLPSTSVVMIVLHDEQPKDICRIEGL